MTSEELEHSLGIPPDSKEPQVYSLSRDGKILAHASGKVTDQKLDKLLSTLHSKLGLDDSSLKSEKKGSKNAS